MEIFDADKGLLIVVEYDKDRIIDDDNSGLPLHCPHMIYNIVQYSRNDVIKKHQRSIVDQFVNKILRPVVKLNFNFSLESALSRRVRKVLLQITKINDERKWKTISAEETVGRVLKGNKNKKPGCLVKFKKKKQDRYYLIKEEWY